MQKNNYFFLLVASKLLCNLQAYENRISQFMDINYFQAHDLIIEKTA